MEFSSNMKSFFAKIYAAILTRKLQKQQLHAVHIQNQILLDLVQKSKETKFGKAHCFEAINSYEAYQRAVPVRDYEEFQIPYMQDLIAGESDVLWPGKPIYF